MCILGLYLLMIVVAILSLSGTFVISMFATTITDFTTLNYYSTKGDDNNNEDDSVIGQDSRLQICCSWSTKLSDGILKYSIDIQEEDEQEGRNAIINAIKEWDSKLDGLQLIEEKPYPLASDIQITFGELNDDETGNQYYDFKNKVDEDLTLIPSAGWTQFTFDKQGSIDGTKIIISADVLEQDFSENMIEQIAKHELGHAFGLGHANYEESIMADLVIEDATATISECEINGVYAANSWKFIDSKRNPERPDRMFISC
jgi:matrixin